MEISFSEKIRRKMAVDFVLTNSRLEGLDYEIPEITRLYQDYIEGHIDSTQLVEKTRMIMENRLVNTSNVAG